MYSGRYIRYIKKKYAQQHAYTSFEYIDWDITIGTNNLRSSPTCKGWQSRDPRAQKGNSPRWEQEVQCTPYSVMYNFSGREE